MMPTMTSKAAEGRVAAPADPVWVLAADEDVLVRFADWQIVRQLYRFVGTLEKATLAARRDGELRVVGACVEVDSVAVAAWRVDGERLAPLVEESLGDGALLRGDWPWATDALLDSDCEVKSPILRVSDDGMLIVLDEDGLESTIDLTMLAAVGRSR